MNVLHMTAQPRVVYRAVCVDWNQEKLIKHAGMSTLMYKLDMKAANVDTHTHKVSTITLVRMCAKH